jgi:hypothetical protein
MRSTQQGRLRTHCVVFLLGVLAAFCLWPLASASATSPAPKSTASPNGPVLAIATSGNTIYLGGNFSQVGTATGTWASLSSSSGQLDRAMPQVAGSDPELVPGVFAEVSDGAGGWYIGGSFTSVGGLPRNGVAHILANGTVDPNFNPNVVGQVYSMVLSGSTLYLGGLFTTVNGSTTRNFAAAVNATTGTATEWNPDPNSAVDALAVSGSTVYMGGEFEKINGSTERRFAAAVDASTGTASTWNPKIEGTFGEVNVLTVSGSTVYLGGEFGKVDGQVRGFAAAVDASTAAVNTWNPNLSLGVSGGRVDAMVVSGSTVYLGGIFDHLNGGSVARDYLASVNATTGVATSWNPEPNNNIKTMELSGSTLYVGGELTAINGSTPRDDVAAIETSSGTATSWNPSLGGGGIYSLAVSGSNVGVGGTFSYTEPQARSDLAAIDATTGKLTSWNPEANGIVNALAVSGNTVYAGGDFSTVNGSTERRHLAALDATSGIATSWDPEPNNGVNALAIAGETLYAGGAFTTVEAGAATRNRAAAFDSSGALTSWNPNFNETVNSLAILGSTVYLGGEFTTVNGSTSRNYAAAVDSSTGIATAWNPNPNLYVTTLAPSGSSVYLGGGFSTVNGSTARNHLAAVDTINGTASSWNPNLSGSFPPSAIAVSGSTIYVGGGFQTVNGSTPRANLASFDATTGTASAWDPSPDSSVTALAVGSDGTVYAGGDFTSFPTEAQPYFAAFSPTAEPPVATTEEASAITQTSATLNATVDPEGNALEECFFEYGPSASYGSTVGCGSLPGGAVPVALSAAINGLSAGETYHFRIVAKSVAGSDDGADQTLTTAAPATTGGGSSASTGSSSDTGSSAGVTPIGGGGPSEGVASTPKAVEELLLGCTGSQLVLNDVYVSGSHVAIAGSAAKNLVGKKVKILFGAANKQVATATVQANGLYSTTAPLPAARIREAPSARYTAKVGNLRSLHLKLTRRLLLEPPKSSGSTVTLTGQVTRPLTKPISAVAVEQQLQCGKTQIVKSFTPSASGHFQISLTVPSGAKAAVYRLKSKVAVNAHAGGHGFTTDSLPLPVVIG